ACSPAVKEGPQPLPTHTTTTTTSTVPKTTGAEAPPTVRLPADVRPIRYGLVLEIVPSRDRFSGTVDIEVQLDKARDVVWLHGAGLTAKVATVTPQDGAAVAARYEQLDEDGLVALRLEHAIDAGKANIHIEFDAPFGRHLDGLYRVDTGGQSYAFTQFEAVTARRAFPGFDEPVFKTPFDVTLRIAKGQEAVANTKEIARGPLADGLVEVKFARTQPLPTYLLCWAVGALDIVEEKDLPPTKVRPTSLALRGVATNGRGRELRFALARTGAIVTALEDYLGIAYPFDKLDIIAVPDKQGAMENPGAITFSEWLVLVDEKTAPVDQKRAFEGVMAHELAHIWFGDLVTMPWWDDLWLNEAFASWMGPRIVTTVAPAMQAEVHVLGRVQDAMGLDGLVSARRIRQPIESTHDIHNAFDGITYQKGSGVIAMFERWVGPEVFRKGLHRYLEAHRFGNATAKDLFAALSEESKKDVATPFATFVDQPGVPVVSSAVVCDAKPHLTLAQARHLPLGSTGDTKATWQIPVCARYSTGKKIVESCTLLTSTEGTLPLDGCPEWVMPNSDAAGYYRFALAGPDLAKLTKAGLPHLSVRERLAVADSLFAAFSRGTTPAADILGALEPFAKDAHPMLATQPQWFVSQAREWMVTDPLRAKIEAYARKLYGPALSELGYAAKKGKPEDDERSLLRSQVLWFLATTARQPDVRKELAKRGRDYVGYGGDGAIHDATVDANLVGLALAVAVEESDAAFFDALEARLGKTDDAVLRGRLLGALGHAKIPALVARARALAFDTRLKVSETLWTVWPQLDEVDLRADTWKFLEDNFDKLVARLGRESSLGIIGAPARFCDDAEAAEVEKFLKPRIEKIEGGPRALATTLERIHLCAARKKAQLGSVRAFFAKK
ncbi:MAG: M1 family metallopeptidase, partial [Polyangiales bacterium]